VIIERPKHTFAIEAQQLPAGVSFRHDYQAYNLDTRTAYDTRYLAQYQYANMWIAGWWQTYWGWLPIQEPTPLYPSYPFHHPWAVAAEYAEPVKQAQRKPLQREARGGWWAVELSNDPTPTLRVPDLSQNIPALPGYDGKTIATKDKQFSATARAILALPFGTLAGLSNCRKPESIAAWAWACARWASANPPDQTEDTWLQAVHDYQWTRLLA
jgi:hypothetical protein